MISNSGHMFSRKGSGDESRGLDTSLGFMYNTNKPTFGVVPQNSNQHIGAVLTPNVDLKINMNRRETRASESEKIKTQGKLTNDFSSRGFLESPENTEKSHNQVLIFENSRGRNKKSGHGKMLNKYTEKFDYKKFIDQELGKLGIFAVDFLS